MIYRYTLRPIVKDDLRLRVEWMSSPEIYETMHFEQPITMTATLNWFERIKSAPMRADFVLEKEGTVVAMTGIIQQLPNNIAESYTFVAPKFLGKGIGTAARFSGLVYAFTIINLDKVVSIIDSDNKASIRLSEKLGFKFVDIVRDRSDSQPNIKKRYRYVCTKESFIDNLFDFEIVSGFVNVKK